MGQVFWKFLEGAIVSRRWAELVLFLSSRSTFLAHLGLRRHLKGREVEQEGTGSEMRGTPSLGPLVGLCLWGQPKEVTVRMAALKALLRHSLAVPLTGQAVHAPQAPVSHGVDCGPYTAAQYRR